MIHRLKHLTRQSTTNESDDSRKQSKPCSDENIPRRDSIKEVSSRPQSFVRSLGKKLLKQLSGEKDKNLELDSIKLPKQTCENHEKVESKKMSKQSLTKRRALGLLPKQQSMNEGFESVDHPPLTRCSSLSNHHLCSGTTNGYDQMTRTPDLTSGLGSVHNPRSPETHGVMFIAS